MITCIFGKYLFLENGVVPSFELNWIPITYQCFVSCFVRIALVVLEKNMKMWNVNKQNQWTTPDNRRSLKLKWAFSSVQLNCHEFWNAVKAKMFFSNIDIRYAQYVVYYRWPLRKYIHVSTTILNISDFIKIDNFIKRWSWKQYIYVSTTNHT